MKSKTAFSGRVAVAPRSAALLREADRDRAMVVRREEMARLAVDRRIIGCGIRSSLRRAAETGVLLAYSVFAAMGEHNNSDGES